MKDTARTLTSFSGADLTVTFASRVIGELQSISWAIERKKAPVYTLGSPDPRSFSRGIRGIAGSFVFAVFDRDALYLELAQAWNEIAPTAMFTAAGNRLKRDLSQFDDVLSMTEWNSVGNSAGQEGVGTNGSTAINVPNGFYSLQKEHVVYADMIPPFDITLTFANEYGQAAFQKIYDADILNEGSGVSVDSIVMERAMTFVARRISPIIKGVYVRDAGGGDKIKDVIGVNSRTNGF